MAKKFCRQVGCTNIIKQSSDYCSEHIRHNTKTQQAKFYNKNSRDKKRAQFYNSAQWKKLRSLHLSAHPLCLICFEPGEIVDHVKEISDGGCATCLDNLQTLCKSCHNTKTSKAAKLRKQGEGGSKC